MKKPKEMVKEIVSSYIKEKPERIRLKLDWNDNFSLVYIYGKNFNKEIELKELIDFNSFAHGVLEAYKEAYGELKVIPISFREEIYENEEVSLDLYPTGSAGIFDIFVKYRK